MGLLAVVDAEQRRLRQVDKAALDEGTQVPVKEGQKQGRDVMAVRVGVHHEDDLVVAKALDVELLAHAASQGRDHVLQLLVRKDLLQGGLFGVEDLAAQRQDGLGLTLAALLGRATGRVAFHDEQLASDRVSRRAIGQLAGQVQPVRDGGLA